MSCKINDVCAQNNENGISFHFTHVKINKIFSEWFFLVSIHVVTAVCDIVPTFRLTINTPSTLSSSSSWKSSYFSQMSLMNFGCDINLLSCLSKLIDFSVLCSPFLWVPFSDPNLLIIFQKLQLISSSCLASCLWSNDLETCIVVVEEEDTKNNLGCLLLHYVLILSFFFSTG